MKFYEILFMTIGLLRHKKRISCRALKRQFDLDDAYLEDLKFELIHVEELAIEQDGEMLIWSDDTVEPPNTALSPSRPKSVSVPPRNEEADPSVAVVPDSSAQIESLPVKTPAVDAERRQLTVMFCDLVGSTALSTQLDPEELREVILAYQKTCAEVIKRFDGFIAKYMGDGVLVYFGYPQALEDGAERALRTGVEIVEAMVGLNAEVGQVKGGELAVRIGIATGLVVVGDIIGEGAAEERAVVGETPNLAARLQGVAEPNGVVIGAATRELVGELFELEDLGYHNLKGIPEPEHVWQVVGISAVVNSLGETRSADVLPVVGRQEELGLLQRAWQQSKEGLGQVVMVNGEPGIGKSTLVETVGEWVKAEQRIRIDYHCSPYHTSSAFYPVINHLQRLLGFEQQDSVEEKVAKLEGGLKDYSLPVAEVIPLFAALLSVALPKERHPPLDLPPEQLRQQTQDALVALVLEEAERQPLLVVWEDLHWADPSTLEFLELVIEQCPTVPILNILVFRPEFVPAWQSRSHMTPLTLNRLERPEVEAMIRQQTGGKALPAEVVEHIVTKTDGVPLFVEELTKTMLQSALMHEEAARYVLTGPLAAVAIPATLQDSLMARLDRLPTVREVAQMGAVLGREFAYEAISALTAVEEAVLQDGLGQLVEAEVLYQRGRVPRAKYIFKHALIQDAAYQSLLKRTRQQYHRQVAELLEARFPEMVETQPELVAYHYTEGSCQKQAVDYWQRAGEHAVEHSAYAETVNHLSKGLEVLELLPDMSERTQQELDMQISLGSALMATRGYAAVEVEKTYLRARELCRHLGDTPQLFPVLHGLYRFYHVRGELEVAREVGQQLLDLAQGEQDPVLLLEAHRALGVPLFWLGEVVAARAQLELGIGLYDRGRDHPHTLYGIDPGVVCLSYKALALWYLGSPDQALESSHQALTLAQELAHPHSLALAGVWAAWLHQFRREERMSKEQAEAAITLCTEQGFPLWLAMGTILAGWTLTEEGEVEKGIIQMRQGIADLRATGAGIWQPCFLALLAEVYGKEGQVQKGLAVLDEAMTIMNKNSENFYEAELHRLKGHMLLSCTGADKVEAEGCFRKANEIARAQKAKSLELRAVTSLARLWSDQGKSEQARDLLTPIYDWFTEGFDLADLKEAKVLLSELGEEG